MERLAERGREGGRAWRRLARGRAGDARGRPVHAGAARGLRVAPGRHSLHRQHPGDARARHLHAAAARARVPPRAAARRGGGAARGAAGGGTHARWDHRHGRHGQGAHSQHRAAGRGRGGRRRRRRLQRAGPAGGAAGAWHAGQQVQGVRELRRPARLRRGRRSRRVHAQLPAHRGAAPGDPDRQAHPVREAAVHDRPGLRGGGAVARGACLREGHLHDGHGVPLDATDPAAHPRDRQRQPGKAAHGDHPGAPVPFPGQGEQLEPFQQVHRWHLGREGLSFLRPHASDRSQRSSHRVCHGRPGHEPQGRGL
mmetsp:Transcript_55240/g.157234  ORF Transcript_55240/g.157234 Transcript_55240/m.157234 type:complete len:311 (-) Transcript_55240:777-1709(-)